MKYANLLKEVFDENGKIVERKAVSLDLETTTDTLIEHFIKQGYVITEYSDKRLY